MYGGALNYAPDRITAKILELDPQTIDNVGVTSRDGGTERGSVTPGEGRGETVTKLTKRVTKLTK